MRVRTFALWVVVAIPLLWGVFKTLQNALKLFQ